MSSEPVMRVAEVYDFLGPDKTIVHGPPGSADCHLRQGDRVRLEDADGVVHGRLLGVMFHTRPGDMGLTLTDLDGDVRVGQALFADPGS